jgi:hypothetical protein
LNASIIALPSKNQRKKYIHENHLNSSDQLYMQQTNKQTAARREGGRVARQPHMGQHLHVPLSQADIVTD